MSAGYPPEAKAAALAALAEGGTLDAAADAAAELAGRRPSRSTVRQWAKAEGLDLDAIRAARDPARQTDEARKARLAAIAAERERIVDLLRNGITLAGAELLAAKLARATEDERLVDVARAKWRDCLVVEAQAVDFGPDAVRTAKQASALAKVDVLVAEANTPDAGELSLIISRAVRDLLAITGEADTAAGEDLTVVLTAPRPARGPITIVQLPAEEALV